MPAYHGAFRHTWTNPPAETLAAPIGNRGLLPNAASRTLSSATPPAVRRIDDKGRIHHPALADLPGWHKGVTCILAVDGDYLNVRPADGPGPDQGRFDGTRLHVPAARLQAIGVAPGEDVAVLADPDTGTATLAAGAHLTDAFWAVGELEGLRQQLSDMTAERDAAVAQAAAATARANVLAEVLGMPTAEPPVPALVRAEA